MAASTRTLWASVIGAASLCWIGGFLSCATNSSVPSATTPSAILTDVAVESQGEATIVDLVGPDDPVFTAFLGRDPLRVVVDLAEVRPDLPTDSLSVYDGLVDEVSVAEFNDATGASTTRVELTLASEADYEVIPQTEGLRIRVVPVATTTAQPDSELEPIDGVPAEESDGNGLGEEIPDQPVEPQNPATHLLAVWSEVSDQGTVIRLRTDGRPMALESFTLEDPARLVIDLPDLQTEVSKPRIDVEGRYASRVRVGQHPDKVRVVIDGGDDVAPFEEHQIVRMNDGLLVTMGGGELVSAALEEAGAPAPLEVAEVENAGPVSEAQGTLLPEEATDAGTGEPSLVSVEPSESAPPAEEPEIAASDSATLEAEAPTSPEAPESSVRVYGVQYDAQELRDRVAILSEHPIEYQLLRPDPETLVVSFPNARLDPKAEIRVAPDGEGPVSLVSAFQQPDVSEPEVRVVVKRAPGLLPQVTRQGTMLFLDFARAGAVAERPPVLTQVKPPEPGAAAPPDVARGEEGANVPRPSAAAEKAVASAAASIAPETPPAALEPEQAIQVLEEGGLLDGKEYVGRRISLDFKDVEIQDVLRLIADVSDLNLIAGDEVQGKVTIRLVDVPWDQALDVILLTKGLGFVRVGNVLRIAPAEILKQEEEARLQERRAKERLEDLVVKLQPVNYADVDEVSTMVKRLLTARGSVDVDKRTNTVIIKDIASVIDEATALIKAIDTQTPQVLIEAKVVEANLDFSRELGSEWGLGSNPDEDENDFELGGVEPITNQGRTFPFQQANNVVVRNPIASTATGLLNLGAFILDNRFDVDLRIAAAESEGEGKVISSPRVVTLDNREALIQQGVSIPFQTFENGDAQLEFIDAVLMLKVTPHITADKRIIMKIEVTRNAPDDSVPTPTGSPAIAKNQAKTETLVQDGQTLVLGGIYVINKTESSSRVPFLYSVPVLGKLFQNQEVRDIRKELLIFVTPRIVIVPELPS